MEEKRINDELLSMINGGVLKEGWENTVLTMINVLKAKYADEGKQTAHMRLSVSNPDGKR